MVNIFIDNYKATNGWVSRLRVLKPKTGFLLHYQNPFYMTRSCIHVYKESFQYELVENQNDKIKNT